MNLGHTELPTDLKPKYIVGDSLEVLKTLPEECINTVVTSPPYWGLRDYGKEGQLGLEKTPEEYVNKMVNTFQEIKRVLRNDGTVWLNLGDSYWGGKGASGHADKEYQQKRIKNKDSLNTSESHVGGRGKTRPSDGKHEFIKPKDLVGIPWMVAFALRSDGWYLRQDIIWNKPNPMPESVTDRCTKAHEYIFLLSKSKDYYFDQESIMEITKYNDGYENKKRGDFEGKWSKIKGKESFRAIKNKRNKRSVWTVTTKPYKGAHFALFPEDLIEPCILAGCPKDGMVLDPFVGSGTTLRVSRNLGRRSIGIDLNDDFKDLAVKRAGLKRADLFTFDKVKEKEEVIA